MEAMILEKFKEPMVYREVPEPAIGSEDILLRSSKTDFVKEVRRLTDGEEHQTARRRL